MGSGGRGDGVDISDEEGVRGRYPQKDKGLGK